MLTHLTPESRPGRVVVLGRFGFLAKALVEELRRHNIPVEAVGRPEIDLTTESSVTSLADLLRPDDSIVIPAALTPDKGRDFHTYMKNLRMAEHLCELFEHRPCAHVVYISSDAVYDGLETPIDETSSREPVDLYALMHTAREMMLGSVAGAKNIPYCVLRPTAVYGAMDTHNSYGPNRFVRTALTEGKIVLFGNGEEERDHIYVDDVAKLTALVVSRRSVGTLNVVTGRAVSFMTVAHSIVRLAGRNVAIESRPRASAITHRPFNTSALTAAFPGFPFTPLEDGLRETIVRASATAK